jgi:hypothetical protein
MDPALGIGASAAMAAPAVPVAPIAPVVPVMTPSLTRDSFNSQSLGRGLNAHVKQVGTRTIASPSHIQPGTSMTTSLPQDTNEMVASSRP